METGYVALFWFVVVAASVVSLFLLLSALIRPKRRYTEKSGISYEHREEPIGEAWSPFNIRFYIFAIIFIIFDVEVIILFPCALFFKSTINIGEDFSVFIKLFLFILILIFGLIYCWGRGDLEWLKTIARNKND